MGLLKSLFNCFLEILAFNQKLPCFTSRSIKASQSWGSYTLLKLFLTRVTSQFLFVAFRRLKLNHIVRQWPNFLAHTMPQVIYRIKWFINLVQFRNWWWDKKLQYTENLNIVCSFWNTYRAFISFVWCKRNMECWLIT